MPYEALVSIGSPDSVLAHLTSELLAGDGAGLRKLIDITGRYATTSRRQPDGEALQLDDVLAAPVVALIGNLFGHLPQRLNGLATQLVRRWLVSLEVNGRQATVFIPDPTMLSAAVAGWTADSWYGETYDAALAVVGLLGCYLSPDARALLDRAKQRGHDLDVVVEDPEVAAALARDNPDLLLELAGYYYLDLPLTRDPEAPGRRPARSVRRRPGRNRTGLSGYEDEDGVREHSHRTSRRLGFGLAGPDWGPFAVLLASSPAHGLRLVGAVVDAASDARIRVEASFADPPDTVQLPLRLPHWNEAMMYSGPGTAWGWYRRTGNGAYTAMSALMALRAWAKTQLVTRPLADVLDDLLSAGECVAFPAVAYSLVVLDLAAAGDIVDGFLEHPAVWDLEIGRVVGERGLPRASDDQDALQIAPDQIAMRMVVTGDDERKGVLKAVGERLLARSREALGNPDDDTELPVARRRALMFDSASYRAAPSTEQPGMVEISVEVPADVREQLEQGGGRAANLNLTLTNAMFAARKVRDREATKPRAAHLYAQIQDVLQSIAETPGAYQLYTVDDARAIAAAAVVVRVAAGEDEARALLPEAVSVLTSIANMTKPEPESYQPGSNVSWDMSADRSAATALPMVLLDGNLVQASGVARPDIAAAVERLSTSTSREVHQRLTAGLAPVWGRGCHGDEAQQASHATATAVYRELLLGAGVGPWNGQERPHVRLAAPLDASLEQPDVHFDVGVAVDALPSLKVASACDCEHGQAARATLGTLIEHDLRVWPAEWARHRYHSSGPWRRELDAWVANQVLAGDDGLLDRYLDSFAAVPEQLAGLLTTLADRAISPEQAQRLFDVWPTILDRLLPEARHVPGPDDERSSWREMADLDKALLPKRPDAAPWSGLAFGRILQRWMDAYAPQPRLCDRLTLCLASFGHAISPEGIGLILRMLGDNPARILQDSRYVMGWLHLVLLERPCGPDAHRATLHQLVDDLAARGSLEATQIQRELEA